MMRKEENIRVKGKHSKPIVTDVFYKADDRPKPIVIFCHGYKGFKDWGPWNLVAEKFAEKDFFFIKFNFSHNGGTADNPIDFPDLEAFANDNFTKQLDDLESVINWIFTAEEFSSEVDTKNLSLIGHSRGGGITTLMAAQNSRIKQLITWAGVSDFASRFPTGEALDKWRKTGVSYVENGRTKQKMPHYIQFYEDFIENEEKFNIEKAVKQIQIPHLIVHAKGDPTVDISEAEQLHQWNPSSELFLLEGSDHVFSTKHPWEKYILSEDLEKVTQKSISFITTQKQTL